MHLEDIEPQVKDFPYYSHHTHAAGPVMGRFLQELHDNKRIMGTRCPSCNKVYAPARPFCMHCAAALEEWVEVSNEGELLTYAVVSKGHPYQPRNAPFVLGVIQLEGSDSAITHLLGGIDPDPDKVRIGMKVKAVFDEGKRGSILNIKYFESVS